MPTTGEGLISFVVVSFFGGLRESGSSLVMSCVRGVITLLAEQSFSVSARDLSVSEVHRSTLGSSSHGPRLSNLLYNDICLFREEGGEEEEFLALLRFF